MLKRIARGVVPVVLALCVGLFVPAAQAAPPIDPDEARPHVRWTDAHRIIDRVGFVSGTIANVKRIGRVTLLNFDNNNPSYFSGVIYEGNLGNFPGDLKALYEGKNVEFRGLVSTFRGRPQIKLFAPTQIRILDELPDVAAPVEHKVEAGAEITVATYNILNLFDEHEDPYRDDDPALTKPRPALEKIAKVIRGINADVLALEEVENRFYLERFVEVFLPDMGYEVVHFEGNDIRGIDVCLLSRLPVGVVRSHRHVTFPGPDGETMRFERDLLCVAIEPAGGAPFEVWVVHLKSNYEGRPYAEPIRLAEARKVRRLLDERLRTQPETGIILCGDFNDTWESETLQTLVGADPYLMRCFADEVPEERRITYNRPEYASMIDFILSSPAMARRYVTGSYGIRPGTEDDSGADHNPVWAKFKAR